MQKKELALVRFLLNEQQTRPNTCILKRKDKSKNSTGKYKILLRKPKTVIDGKIESSDQLNKDIVATYGTELLEQLKNSEKCRKSNLQFQKRAQIIDNMLQTQMQLDQSDQSFFHAVLIFDLYLDTFETQEIKNKRLDLIGITSLFIACKMDKNITLRKKFGSQGIYNEQISDKALLKCEKDILFKLNWQINLPTCIDFLSFFLGKFKRITNKFKKIVLAIMTLALLNEQFSKWKPSQIVIASISIACYQLDRENEIMYFLEQFGILKPEEINQTVENGNALGQFIKKFPYDLHQCQQKYNFELTGKRPLLKFNQENKENTFGQQVEMKTVKTGVCPNTQETKVEQQICHQNKDSQSCSDQETERN